MKKTLFALVVAGFIALGIHSSFIKPTTVLAQTGPVPTCSPDDPHCGMHKAPKK